MKKKLILTLITLMLVPSVAYANEDETLAVANETPVVEEYKYTVDFINNDGSFKTEKSTNDYKEAETLLATKGKNGDYVIRSKTSKSPLKIVAANGALIQAYPYRRGTLTSPAPAELLNIYANKGLSGYRTYIGAHYKMFYHGTYQQGTSFVAEVSISGFKGYVDLDKTDIIPYKFIDKGISISLGGSEEYYTNPEQVYKMVITPDYYENVYNSTYKINELTFMYNNAWPTMKYGIYNYAKAPKWLPVGKYYSVDGIKFYHDYKLTRPVMNGSKQGEFYSYHQFLPIRSLSTITANELDSWLKSQGYAGSVMHGNGKAFVDNGKKYGMNALTVYAMAGLESAYGTSYLAKDRYNLFGWNAFDSNPGLATTYQGVDVAVKQHMSSNLKGYVDITDWRFGNYSVGHKGAGLNRMYASDPYWGMKIGSLSYKIDKAYGFKFADQYELGKLQDNLAINVRSGPSATASVLYVTPALPDQIITILGEENGFYKTNLHNAENLSTQIGYISKDLVTKQPLNYGKWVDPNPPTEPEKPVEPEKPTTPNIPDFEMIPGIRNYIVSADGIGLRLREYPTTESEQLDLIPDKTIFSGQKTSTGWIKVTYNGKTGYVSGSFVKEYTKPEETKPPVVKPPVSTDYKSGDVNNDGKISLIDLTLIKRDMVGIAKLKDKALKAADMNKDNKISLVDLTVVKRHLVGISLIKW